MQNGYNLDDLRRVSKDVRERPLATLRRLGLTPDHLVEYNTLLPIEQLQFTPREIASKLTGGGLGYNPKARCVCSAASGAKWTLQELIHIGFVFDDLLNIGVDTRERWDSLGKKSVNDLKRLGVRQQDIDALPYETLASLSSDEEDERVMATAEEEEPELVELDIPVLEAEKVQKAANALYLQPKRRLVKE